MHWSLVWQDQRPVEILIMPSGVYDHSNRIGEKKSIEARRKMSKAKKGKKLTLVHAKKISIALIGKNTWMAGRKASEETRKKLSILHSGEKHWNWKGGISSFDKRQRHKFQMTVQKEVFERDDYTCQLCGIKGGKLQVDHIQSWAEYVDLRFDMNNCRTLCMDCHYLITFGKPKPKEVKTWGHNLKVRVTP